MDIYKYVDGGHLNTLLKILYKLTNVLYSINLNSTKELIMLKFLAILS